jgi:predicted GIY-YIG superfamily endonuclease
MAGPFQKSEEGKTYIELGLQHARYHCISCARTIGTIKAANQKNRSDQLISSEEDMVESSFLEEETKKAKKRATTQKDPVHVELTETLIGELQAKREIPVEGTWLTYIAERSNDSYTCGVTRDLTEEARALNQAGYGKLNNLPVDIVYFRAESDKDGALRVRDILSKYKREQKDRLIKVFEKQYFSDEG